MGRRSVKATKSGKFMNPTDQARKEARKKELKKNKKQRLLVRTAVLKNKDPGSIIRELDKLDEVEFNTLEPPPLADKVLKDKRKKLKETLDRVMKLYQKDNPQYWNELKRIESDYERRKFHRIQYFEAVKQAESVSNVEDIPLPDIPMPGDGEVGDIPLPDAPVGLPGLHLPPLMLPPMPMMGIPIPPPPMEVQSILKKAPMVAVAPGTPSFQGRDPPGVPCGPPPDLAEMDEDDSSDDEMESEPEVSKKVDNKKKGVRFSDTTKEDDDPTMSEMDRFMKEVEEEFNNTNEDSLNPPGMEGEPGSRKPEKRGKEPEPEEADESEMSTEGSYPLHKPDTAASTATEIAAASSSRPPVPGQPFYPPPPGRMHYPPPMPPMMRPNFPPGPRHIGPYIPSGGPGSRFRPPRANVFSGQPQIVKSDSKIVSDSMIQAKPQIRSLSADVTRFIPTVVKTKKDEPGKKPEYQIGQSHLHFREPQPPRPPQQSKDDAYAVFMKEMQGLL